MGVFIDYLDPAIPLWTRMQTAFEELTISSACVADITAFMEPIRVKHRPTYEHSIRVGLLARQIGSFMHLDPKALLFAGLLHDVGKAQTSMATLAKMENWTPADTEEIKHHVMDGYRLIRDHFDFSAEIILWHHKFQWEGYPKRLPRLLHDYSLGTRMMIALYGRMVSLSDTFDALHRTNDKFGPPGTLTGEFIKQKMYDCNPDQRAFLGELYAHDIFTIRMIQEIPVPVESEPALVS